MEKKTHSGTAEKLTKKEQDLLIMLTVADRRDGEAVAKNLNKMYENSLLSRVYSKCYFTTKVHNLIERGYLKKHAHSWPIVLEITPKGEEFLNEFSQKDIQSFKQKIMSSWKDGKKIKDHTFFKLKKESNPELVEKPRLEIKAVRRKVQPEPTADKILMLFALYNRGSEDVRIQVIDTLANNPVLTAGFLKLLDKSITVTPVEQQIPVEVAMAH